MPQGIFDRSFTDARSPGSIPGTGNVGILGKAESYQISDPLPGMLRSKPRGDARFHALLKQIGDLHDKKQLDYGADNDPFANVRASSFFGIPAWVGCMIRANDKMKRIQQFAKKGSLANESLKDSLMDLAVYSLIALVLFEEETEKKL